ncbi:MAG: hypothetical protein WDN45_04250 [Caulobacteraceae bacterium]
MLAALLIAKFSASVPLLAKEPAPRYLDQTGLDQAGVAKPVANRAGTRLARRLSR